MGAARDRCAGTGAQMGARHSGRIRRRTARPGPAPAGVFGALVAVPLYAALSILVHEHYLFRQDAR